MYITQHVVQWCVQSSKNKMQNVYTLGSLLKKKLYCHFTIDYTLKTYKSNNLRLLPFELNTKTMHQNYRHSATVRKMGVLLNQWLKHILVMQTLLQKQLLHAMLLALLREQNQSFKFYKS